MESREKCEQIIQIFNGNTIQGAKDPLLVKFADGGPKKKNLYKNPDPNARTWRDPTEGMPVTYDPTMQQNGVSVNVGTPIGVPYSRFSAPPVSSYPMTTGSQWIPGYMMTQQIPQVEDQVSKISKKNFTSSNQYTISILPLWSEWNRVWNGVKL